MYFGNLKKVKIIEERLIGNSLILTVMIGYYG